MLRQRLRAGDDAEVERRGVVGGHRRVVGCTELVDEREPADRKADGVQPPKQLDRARRQRGGDDQLAFADLARERHVRDAQMRELIVPRAPRIIDAVGDPGDARPHAIVERRDRRRERHARRRDQRGHGAAEPAEPVGAGAAGVGAGAGAGDLGCGCPGCVIHGASAGI